MLVDLEKCIKIQERLSHEIILEDEFPEKIKIIGGADQAFLPDNRIISCLTVLEYPSLNLIEKKISVTKVDFPYIPGFLAFRESPTVFNTYHQLEKKPDILIIDGHGIAHPRKMGLATHLGIKLDKPTIGVAKKKLIGQYDLPKKVGQYKPLEFQDSIVGYVLKTKKNCNPVFVSPGHKISLKSSLKMIRSCIKTQKLPEPIWLAHKFANQAKKCFPLS